MDCEVVVAIMAGMKSGPLHSFLPTAASLLLFSIFTGTTCAQTAAWLSSHQFKNPTRIEGLLDEPNARLEYEVRGFEALSDVNNAEVRNQANPELRIEYCRSSVIDPDDSKNKTAYIEVRPRRSDLEENYLMKAYQKPSEETGSLGWNAFSWPTKDVIRKSDINTNDLSVVIHMGEDNRFAEKIQPAVFTAVSSEQAPQTPPARIDRYMLYLLIQRDALKSLSYTYRSGSGAAKTCYYGGERQPCAIQKPSSAPLVEVGTIVRLQMDMSGMPEGNASVQVRGTYALGADSLNATFRFVHTRTCR
jgi:hypothetical protein